MKKTIVKTDNYLLVVDDSEIKKGNLILTPYGKVVKALDVHTTEFTGVGTALNDCMKITAHLPLNDSPILEGVMLLPIPPLEVEDGWVIENGYDILSHRRGYDQARGKYNKFYASFNTYLDNELEIGISDKKTIERIRWYFSTYFQSLSQSKTPTHFDFEMERGDLPYYVIKTTTNSQGQEVACGQYTFAS